MEKILIKCPNSTCTKPYSVPVCRPPGKVTCPFCKYKFDWETRQLDFVCAKTARRFKVIYARINQSGKFTFREAVIPNDNMPLAIQKFAPGYQQIEKVQSFDANEFNHANWCCPHCGYNGDPIFIHCSDCKGQVCAGRIEYYNGKSYFRCHDNCGGHGPIGGSITEFSGDPNLPKTSNNLPLPNPNQLPNKTNNRQIGNNDKPQLGYK